MEWSEEVLQDSGYDIELFENAPDPEFICTICHGVLKNPVELGCQHVFCKSCIAKWLTEKQECPYCRKKVRSVARSVIPMIHNMISRLIMKCENRVYGCQETFPLEQYSNHKAACEFRIVRCKYEACTTEVFQKNLAAHEQVCEHWSQPCRMGCGVQLTQNQLEEHNCYRDVKRKYKEKITVLKSRLSRMHRRLKLVEGIVQNLTSDDHYQFSEPIVYEDESEGMAAEAQEEDNSNVLDAECSENESQYSWNSGDLENGDGQPADGELEDVEDEEEVDETIPEQTTEDTLSVSSRSSTEQEVDRTGSQIHLYFETDDNGSIASENAGSLSDQDASNRKRVRPCMLQCSFRCRKSVWKRSNLSLRMFSRRQHSQPH
ncbi:RING finger protein 151 [Carcharodon carcharias]|uniref:RING finger protein 151 n=1 Tax=Carcharodon carcharias TaxID=13397 RepID=UPI001B7EFCA3|nr:RING finger protein 151 [Carcharodon carcharias]